MTTASFFKIWVACFQGYGLCSHAYIIDSSIHALACICMYFSTAAYSAIIDPPPDVESDFGIELHPLFEYQPMEWAFDVESQDEGFNEPFPPI